MQSMGSGAAPGDLSERLRAIIREDRLAWSALERARAAADEALMPPDWAIVAGCLYQAVLNALTGKASGYGVNDVDLVYFDDRDLGWDAEDEVIRTVRPFFDDLGAPVEIKNQARVHLWYPERFGGAYPKLSHATEGMLYYASKTHAVSATLDGSGQLETQAPFGLEDLFALRIRPNHALDNRATHEAKGARIKSLWPEVEVLPW